MRAHLAVERGPQVGSTFVVRPGAPYLVGSGPGVQARLEGLAARHLALALDAGGLRVVDLEGGATLDGEPLPRQEPRPVGTGQALAVGGVVLRVEVEGQAPLAPPLPSVQGFEVLAALGDGGSGQVLRARRADGREVALKVLHRPLVPGSAEHRRFQREGRVGLRVRSPHVVEVLDAFVDAAGRGVIVLELVRGPSLQATLARERVLPVARALEVAEHVALGLAAAHGQGVLHRDVKPGNVLLAEGGPAKLVDFGLAKDLHWTVDALTRSGAGLGTLGYMSPEQVASARSVDAAADLYALGAVLYRALAGRLPVIVRTPQDLPRVATAAPPALRSLRPDCPAPVEELAHELLAKDPRARPPGAREVAARLGALRA